ncbi:MAG: carbohydrate-binding family 6 protein [Planctomycetota bacterium]|nr:carbohydrate-binding family 6 protein [Planctomycetota bacterium]
MRTQVRLSLSLMLALMACGVASADVGLFYEPNHAPVEFATAEIRAALKGINETAATADLSHLTQAAQQLRIAIAATGDESHSVAAALHCPELKSDALPQSYAVRKLQSAGQTTYIVLAADPAGAMYGALDLAEAIRLDTLSSLQDSDHAPFIPRRGIKFNIPLDARAPSYSDAGDSAQQNIPEMWSLDFWREFLDEMARQRLNTLTLWNLDPFPSLVKVPEYPDVALADVMRTTLPFDTTYALTGRDMVRPAQLQHLEIVKKMSIDQKIKFWQDVMDYAHDRGIDVYLFTWNLFTWDADGKYGITNDQANPITVDYFRKSVRQTLLTYPRLAGIGITAGENMQNLPGEASKERWLRNTYGAAIEDVKKLQPNRSILLIHRLNQATVKPVMAAWKDYSEPFELEYKYSVAHMYSSPTPPFAKHDLAALPPGVHVWFTARNDDIYSFRWGDPNYARAYVRNLPGPEVRAAFLVGSDGLIWGREFTSTEPDSPRQLFIKKQWYSLMLWGRLGFEPDLPNTLFERTLDLRFPEAAPGKLFAASASASKIIPQVTRFFWSGNDLAWFPEACISHPSHRGFYTVKDFINGTSMPGAGVLNIRDYCKTVSQSAPIAGISPPEVAAALHKTADQTLQLLSELPQHPTNKELRLTLGDYQAMAYLGNYYAEKILGATDLAMFDAEGNPQRQTSAIHHLETAAEYWKQYASVATRQYRPQLLTRIGYVDLLALSAKVEKDIEIAKAWKSTGRQIDPTGKPN